MQRRTFQEKGGNANEQWPPIPTLSAAWSLACAQSRGRRDVTLNFFFLGPETAAGKNVIRSVPASHMAPLPATSPPATVLM